MRPKRRAFALLAGLIIAVATSIPAGPPSAARTADPPGRPSFVLIVTDDQRWDTLWAMPEVQRHLVDRGVTFTNGFQLVVLPEPGQHHDRPVLPLNRRLAKLVAVRRLRQLRG